MNTETAFVWIDLETGGLNDRQKDGTLGCESLPILEIAVRVTDTELNELAVPFRLVIAQTEEELQKLGPWPMKTHTESGLLDSVRHGYGRVELAEAEQQVISYLKGCGIEPYDRNARTGGIMCGSSIHFDRSYIMAQMPELHAYLHYRMIDVSAIAMAARYFAPELAGKACEHKTYKHEALQDIWESIQELRVYQEAFARFSSGDE
ncbi:oligoribonuclease [Sansalvadorimonas verongulae]|uniref:oligoribonuclease n=1 Tax=Sansalvadorimonas verongulae TaxID=2172824 RepID=UPI0012BB4AC9|nr:oligoribonuclease [Sansalvadorimonas verongulae]MTI13347.1 oligoribonuclease [Sansalvadorimonas verongulae]